MPCTCAMSVPSAKVGEHSGGVEPALGNSTHVALWQYQTPRSGTDIGPRVPAYAVSGTDKRYAATRYWT
eukprot:1159304-Rhodomonas_salina.2